MHNGRGSRPRSAHLTHELRLASFVSSCDSWWPSVVGDLRMTQLRSGSADLHPVRHRMADRDSDTSLGTSVRSPADCCLCLADPPGRRSDSTPPFALGTATGILQRILLKNSFSGGTPDSICVLSAVTNCRHGRTAGHGRKHPQAALGGAQTYLWWPVYLSQELQGTFSPASAGVFQQYQRGPAGWLGTANCSRRWLPAACCTATQLCGAVRWPRRIANASDAKPDVKCQPINAAEHRGS